MLEGALSRIADDLRVTTGHELELLVEEGSDSWFAVHVFLDGEPKGSFIRMLPSDLEQRLATVADVLREQTLDEEVWGGGPICPDHNTHPLDPLVDADGRAAWRCPRGRVVARIGDL